MGQNVSAFFKKEYEEDINEKMFYRSYCLNKEDVVGYIDQLIKTPLSSFLEYVVSSITIPFLTYQDVVQFSSLEDATTGICRVLGVEDEGLKSIDVGRLLLNDGKERKEGALRKYGENHAKTALELGLVIESYGTYFLSCLGNVYNLLPEVHKVELLRRTILRNRFFQKIVKKAQSGKVSIIKEMSFLAESTVKRRLSNVKSLYRLLRGKEDDPSAHFFDNISIYDNELI